MWPESGPGVVAPEPILPAMTALLPNLWNSNNSVPLDVEATIEAINQSRRRHVLLLVDEQSEPLSAGQLAEEIAASELNKEIPDLNAQERKRVYIALVQCHLDTLNKTGAIEYDERVKQVNANDATAGIADLIRHLESVCEP